jgi:uncharacterized membrane protein
MNKRKFELDVFRGLSIVLMVIFHFAYDLTIFGYASFNTNVDIEWRVFRTIIVSGFLISVGMSSYYAYVSGVRWNKLRLAVAKLVVAALLISLGSLFMYPQQWVYFGVIHFIAVALPLSLLFLHRTNLALMLAIVILAGYFSGIMTMRPIWLWFVDNLSIPKYTVDLVSFVPWFALVLIGMYVAKHNMFCLRVGSNKLSKGLAMMGRHSLIIYLLHQPFLFAGFMLVNLYTQAP